MIIIRIFFWILIIAGISFCLGSAFTSLWLICTKKFIKGLKYFLLGSVLPICIFCICVISLCHYLDSNGNGKENWVTLKGRVVNSNGQPKEGAVINVTPWFTGCDSGEMYNRYPKPSAITDSNGEYELKEVKPLSNRMTWRYMVSSNAAVRSQSFFFVQVTAKEAGDYGYIQPQLTIPAISEKRAKRALHTIHIIEIFHSLNHNNIPSYLPESTGNTIFLPNMLVVDRPQAEPVSRKPVWSEFTPRPLNIDEVTSEIKMKYSQADSDIKDYILWTAKTFGRKKMWFNENAFLDIPENVRASRVKNIAEILKNRQYGRQLTTTLAEASALKDEALVPGLLKIASYQKMNSDYDCRPKWMAVAALARQESDSAVPLLISLTDHGNSNTRHWARAALARIMKKDFKDNKQAWAKWWEDQGKAPIPEEFLKPWVMPEHLRQKVQ